MIQAQTIMIQGKIYISGNQDVHIMPWLVAYHML